MFALLYCIITGVLTYIVLSHSLDQAKRTPKRPNQNMHYCQMMTQHRRVPLVHWGAIGKYDHSNVPMHALCVAVFCGCISCVWAPTMYISIHCNKQASIGFKSLNLHVWEIFFCTVPQCSL